MIFVILVVSIVVFVLSSFTGDPVFMILPPDAPQSEVEAVRIRLGLDQPIYEQYRRFVVNMLKGDFGISYVFNRPALDLILERAPATLEMVFISVLMTIVFAIPLGIYAGANPNTKLSKAIMTGSLVGISLPSFWVGMMLIYIFAVKLGWFPATSRGETIKVFGVAWSLFTLDGLRHLILPSFTLALGQLAMLLRLTRASIQENMKQDYVKYARAKGVTVRDVLFGHAFKNALIPIVTVFGINIGELIAFTTITETIFSWPGMGKLLLDSINLSDRPVIVVYLMVVSVMFVVINFLVDMIYLLIDPRIELR